MKKIIELSTDELANVLILVTPEVGNIIADNEVSGIFTNGKREDETTINFGLRRIVELIPILLRKHRESVYQILSAFNEKSVEEIRNQSGFLTIKEITALISDKDFKDFLEQSQSLEQTM